MNVTQIPYQFLQTDQEIYEAFARVLKAPLRPMDTETTGLDPHTARLLLLQIGDGSMNYVIDMTADNSLARKDKSSPIWRMAIDIFTDRATKIFHNAAYDYKIIKAYFDCELTNIYDTMIAERVLTAGKSVKKLSSLAELATKYAGITVQEMNKAIRAGFYAGYVLDKFSDDQILYSARDIYVLIPIYWAQLSQLADEQLIPTVSLEFSVIPVTANMEYVGVNFDTDKWAQAIEELDTERRQKRREVEAVFKQNGLEKQKSLFSDFCTISIDSSSQLLKALKQMGLPLEDSVNSGILERMTNDYPFLETLLKYKEHQKLVTAFGERLLDRINPVTGRLHGGFMQIGADTGRYSARDPNLQQIPSDTKCSLRDCFIAPPGFVVMGADYSQQELRVLACISGEPNMLAAYAQDEDLHTMTASFLFKRDLQLLKSLLDSRDAKTKAGKFDEITEQENEAKRQRGIAKSINFLIAYGGTYKRLAFTARITEDFAQEVMGNHGNTFPRLKNFIKAEGDNTLRNMYSKTMLGRKRYYVLPDRSNLEYNRLEAGVRRQGVNHIIQGTSADITKQALALIDRRFTERFGRDRAYIWAVIHDEIQTMVREEIAEEAGQVLTKSMEEAYYKFIPKEVCPIKVDAQRGPHWVH
jgi:DNA polymerase I-like protein with 3'-5' exonuclease and polymerase domains